MKELNELLKLVDHHEKGYSLFEFVKDNKGSRSYHDKSIAMNLLQNMNLPEKEFLKVNELINIILFD